MARNWIIKMKTDTTKCVDANAAANGSVVHLNACNGASLQDWTFTPQPTKDGARSIQTAASGRASTSRTAVARSALAWRCG